MLRERRVDVQGLAGWGRVCSFAQHRRGHRMITHSLDQLQVDPTWVIQLVYRSRNALLAGSQSEVLR